MGDRHPGRVNRGLFQSCQGRGRGLLEKRGRLPRLKQREEPGQAETQAAHRVGSPSRRRWAGARSSRVSRDPRKQEGGPQGPSLGSSEDVQPAASLIFALWPPDCEAVDSCYFKLLSWWRFVRKPWKTHTPAERVSRWFLAVR